LSHHAPTASDDPFLSPAREEIFLSSVGVRPKSFVFSTEAQPCAGLFLNGRELLLADFISADYNTASLRQCRFDMAALGQERTLITMRSSFFSSVTGDVYFFVSDSHNFSAKQHSFDVEISANCSKERPQLSCQIH
jgi:hypothetical protein